MGLDVAILHLAYEDSYHGSYATFDKYRIELLKAFEPKLVPLYIKHLNNEMLTEEEISQWNSMCCDRLDIFLLHSNCEGKISWQDCREIYKVISKYRIDLNGHNYGTMNFFNMHEQWLNMFRHCWKRRVIMTFY